MIGLPELCCDERLFFYPRNTQVTVPLAKRIVGQQLLVNPPQAKPEIGPVSTNTMLLNRLNAFLEETQRPSAAAPAELPDQFEGQHVELELACGVFDLKSESTLRMAEAACGDSARNPCKGQRRKEDEQEIKTRSDL